MHVLIKQMKEEKEEEGKNGFLRERKRETRVLEILIFAFSDVSICRLTT